MNLPAAAWGSGLWVASTLSLVAANAFVPSKNQPPAPAREFRGAWVASVSNIDWPSKPGLSTAAQKAELLALLDRAAQLRLNAIILQIRPACDALYASPFEPWSEYLTGQMGRAPEPFYDPLAFAVTQAHQRGLELHAWFNPYRARHSTGKSAASANHISRTRPDLVRTYGKQLWLDPGEKAVQEHSLKVILDVVKRYAIDGVHLDDYFYPYKEKDAAGKVMDFPDEPGWQRYHGSGGKLNREDWRRENVNQFIQRLNQEIHAARPWLKFGVSPFGIWRPGHPESIKGLDAYEELYADSRQWLANGWVDYLAPQLYWPIESKAQSFPVLLNWWSGQNAKQRHLWPGIATSNIGEKYRAEEIAAEIRRTRQQTGATGNIHWSMKPLLQNREGIGDRLRQDLYDQPVLVPASPWLESKAPGKPKLTAKPGAEGTQLKWEPAGAERPWLWLVQIRAGGKWNVEIFPSAQGSHTLKISGLASPEVIALSAVSRCGVISPSKVVEKRGLSLPPSPALSR